ncbi:MAG: KEOPS complex subunit Pcc1 [Halobacteriales archaeon]|nr:KEOPS complex subunit Pcc1 [Halobacteriales archaeon]
MSAAHRSTFSFTYSDPSEARIIERAIRQEVDEIADDRSRTTVERSDDTVRVIVTATDLVALRAACNTWLTLTTVAERAATL